MGFSLFGQHPLHSGEIGQPGVLIWKKVPIMCSLLNSNSVYFNWATDKGLAIITSLHDVHWKSMDQPIYIIALLIID